MSEGPISIFGNSHVTHFKSYAPLKPTNSSTQPMFIISNHISLQTPINFIITPDVLWISYDYTTPNLTISLDPYIKWNIHLAFFGIKFHKYSSNLVLSFPLFLFFLFSTITIYQSNHNTKPSLPGTR